MKTRTMILVGGGAVVVIFLLRNKLGGPKPTPTPEQIRIGERLGIPPLNVTIREHRTGR